MGIIGMPPPPLLIVVESDDSIVLGGTIPVLFISAESGEIDIYVAMVSVTGPVTDG